MPVKRRAAAGGGADDDADGARAEHVPRASVDVSDAEESSGGGSGGGSSSDADGGSDAEPGTVEVRAPWPRPRGGRVFACGGGAVCVRGRG